MNCFMIFFSSTLQNSVSFCHFILKQWSHTESERRELLEENTRPLLRGPYLTALNKKWQIICHALLWQPITLTADRILFYFSFLPLFSFVSFKRGSNLQFTGQVKLACFYCFPKHRCLITRDITSKPISVLWENATSFAPCYHEAALPLGAEVDQPKGSKVESLVWCSSSAFPQLTSTRTCSRYPWKVS